MTRDNVLEEFGAAPGRLAADRMADEIVRLREQLRDTHTKVFHLEEKLTWVERERDQLTSLPAERILAALREPSDAMLDAIYEAIFEAPAYYRTKHGGGDLTPLFLTGIATGLAVAELEAGG